VGAVLALPGTAQAAYPTSPFSDVKQTVGEASGTFTWYARSTGVQGSVTGYCGANIDAQVRFTFWTGINGGGVKVGDTETRTTADCSTRSYNFTKDGSAYSGGIRSVFVQVCSTKASRVVQCSWGLYFNR
jgi:hypothetical protein